MKVVFTPAAEHDLGGLFLYIKDKLHNEIAARNIATKLLQRAQGLASFPDMGASLGNVDRKLDRQRERKDRLSRASKTIAFDNFAGPSFAATVPRQEVKWLICASLGRSLMS